MILILMIIKIEKIMVQIKFGMSHMMVLVIKIMQIYGFQQMNLMMPMVNVQRVVLEMVSSVITKIIPGG